MFSIPGIVIGNSSRRDGMFTIPGSVIGDSSTGDGTFTMPVSVIGNFINRRLYVFYTRYHNW